MGGTNVVQILRSGASIIAGYALLALTSMAFVMIMYVRPMVTLEPALIVVVSAGYNFLCAFGAGYLVALIAGRAHFLHAAVTAGLMTLVTIISIIADVAVEPLSYKLIYFIVMISGTLLGSRFQVRTQTHRAT